MTARSDAMLMVNPAAPMVRARKLAEDAGVLVLIAVVAVVGSALQHIATPALEALSARAPSADVIGATLTNAIFALPSVFLILALLSFREALRECVFTSAAGAALRWSGLWALWALAAKMVLAPTLYGLFEPAPLGLVIAYESFDLGLVGFAALLVLAGRVLEAANGRIDNDWLG